MLFGIERDAHSVEAQEAQQTHEQGQVEAMARRKTQQAMPSSHPGPGLGRYSWHRSLAVCVFWCEIQAYGGSGCEVLKLGKRERTTLPILKET